MYTARKIVQELEKLESGNEVFTRPLGVELEFWVYEDDKPVDLTDHLEFLEGAPGVWACGTDLGKNMLEVAYNPEMDMEDYLSASINFFDYLAKGEVSKHWTFLFGGETHKETIGWVQKPRYVTLIQAIGAEGGQSHKIIRSMTSMAAFQVNIGVGPFEGGVFSSEAKRLLYAFNNWGPALCLYFEQLCDDLGSSRISHGYDFAAPHRGLRYLSWPECDELHSTLYAVPQLMREDPNGSGDWVVYGEKPDYLVPAHTGSIWWLARAQGIGDEKAERVEIRSLNSMSPMASIHAVSVVNRLVDFVLHTEVSDLPTLDFETWEFIRLKEEPEASLAIALNFLKQLPGFE